MGRSVLVPAGGGSPPNAQGLAARAFPTGRSTGCSGHVQAYNVLVLLSFLAAGGLACWWLRALGLGRGAALAGGLVFALAPYRVGQEHRPPARAGLVPPARNAAGPRAPTLVACRRCARGDPPLGAAAPRARGDPALPWLRLGAGAARRTALGGRRVGCGCRSRAPRPAGRRRRLDRRRPLVHPGRALFGRILGFRHAKGLRRHRGAGLRRLAGVAAGGRRAASRGSATARSGLAARPRRRRPAALALGGNLPGYEPLWRVFPPLHATRVPERFMPIACLALAALVAFALELVLSRRKLRRYAARADGSAARCAGDRPAGSVFGAVEPDAASPAYAAMQGSGTLVELPVIRPDIHYGSVYLGYARQSPRERPQGYATTAPPAADRWARDTPRPFVRARAHSCGTFASSRCTAASTGRPASSPRVARNGPRPLSPSRASPGSREDGAISVWTRRG